MKLGQASLPHFSGVTLDDTHKHMHAIAMRYTHDAAKRATNLKNTATILTMHR